MSRSQPRHTSAGEAAAEPVIVLAGGLGTRLRAAVPDVPKVLVPAGGRPFLAWLLAELARQGARRCILSLGHRAEQVVTYLEQARAGLPADLVLETVVEPSPLGTGGAVRHVVERLGLSGPVIVANGDTYLPDGLRELRAGSGMPEHLIGLVRVADTARYGRGQLEIVVKEAATSAY